MKSEEGMDLAKMAVTVLLVVLLIGAVVALVYAAYSWFNSGTDKLSDQVNSIGSSAYSRFDDAQISGTDVLTALKEYRDSNIAIFIANGTCLGTTYSIFGTDGAHTNTTPNKVQNYCAKASGDTVIPTYSADTQQWEITNVSWNPNTGEAERNTNFSPTTNRSASESYVKQGAQFYSNLVYSKETGEVCGILFRQMVGKATPPENQ